jgi:Zn-dependent protease with chaperone function
MPINPNVFTHELDRAALQALKAIPGFTEILKAFMKVWNEQVFYVQNMSTNLRVSQQQLPQYYEMLPPICEKLGIEVPELYIEMNVVPNAYTSGDTKPFIVMTTGLLESMPEELIPTVLAHECGHIACHHVLYSTMGRLILSEAIALLGLDNSLISLPLQMAFYYWMRCSEYSADRAAAICDGSSDKIVAMCMNFAGFNRNIPGKANVEAFLEQAEDYNRMMTDSKWNKTLEFILFNQRSHPLNAVRARECKVWCESDVFPRIQQYLGAGEGTPLLLEETFVVDIPMSEGSKAWFGKNAQETKEKLEALGYTNVRLKRSTDKQILVKVGHVLNVTAGGAEFAAGAWFASNAEIEVTYYEPLSEEEIIALHPGEVRTPDAARRYVGRFYRQVATELMDAGFTNVICEPQLANKKNFLIKEGNVARVTVGGQSQFEKGWWFDPDVTVRVVYYTFESQIVTPYAGENDFV